MTQLEMVASLVALGFLPDVNEAVVVMSPSSADEVLYYSVYGAVQLDPLGRRNEWTHTTQEWGFVDVHGTTVFVKVYVSGNEPLAYTEEKFFELFPDAALWTGR